MELRPTSPEDVPFVLSCEADAEARPFILPWSAEQHLDAIQDPDCRHLMLVERTSHLALGFAMLFGLQSPHGSIELRRIVCSCKGQGVGRVAIDQIKWFVFHQLKAHRLWLDVKASNVRAQRLYRSTGFVEEGYLRECLREADRRESLLLFSILRHEYAG